MSRSGFGGLKKTFAIITVFALFMTVMSVWVKPEQVRAAAKTTVRVATSKQLKSALKDPNVGTIILRTATVDPITISSKKAKKKNLIVDAEESVITNKTKFKSITIVNVAGYIEDVSGNKITLNTNRAFEVAAGRSVKKLTFDNVSPWLPLRYVLRDNASRKKIAFKDDGKVKDLGDGKFSVKKSVYEDEEYNVADYVMEFTFDKSGRITEETSQNVSTDPDNEYNHIYKYEYYDNGNLYRLTTSNPVWAYDLTVESYYYDEN
ncbi:MAG: hypothetical protein J6Y89_06850, partial [Lachnospiraceae bacterium]|nr:hypothetical protein [Lachnospiraceae bacterium]